MTIHEQRNAHWDLRHAREVAHTHLSGMGNRWLHVRAVGRGGEAIEQTGRVSPGFAAAAWLHDIGYAPELIATGFHPLDGARWLSEQGAPRMIVGLVAFHTGAQFEAAERGLGAELGGLPRPSQRDLDAITLVDLTTSPTGRPVTPGDRIREILSRYSPDDPVHQAISAATPWLLRSSDTARRALGLPEGWPFPARQPSGRVARRT